MRRPYRAINRGNIKCFICDDIIDGKAKRNVYYYEGGTEPFCKECYNMGQEEDKATCAICGKEVLEHGDHWTSGACSIDWVTETRLDALLKSAREELTAKGGTAASPVVFVGLASSGASAGK